MKLTIKEALLKRVDAHKDGRIKEANKIYASIFF